MNLAVLILSAFILIPARSQQVTSIKEAIRLTARRDAVEESNRLVTVTGVVTVPSARTDSSLEVFIQDRTSGIRLFEFNYRGPSLFVGDSLVATGRLGIYYGQEEVVSPKIRILRRRLKVGPVRVTAGQVKDGSFHGLLVTCKGTVIGTAFRGNGITISFVGQNDDTASAFLDFRQDPQFEPGDIRIGEIYSLTGISTRFSFKRPYTNGDDIFLRSSADLRAIHESLLSRYSGSIEFVLGIVFVLMVVLASFVYVLRSRVTRKTAQFEVQNRILRVFFDSIAELTGVLDTKKIVTLTLRRAHSLAGTQAAIFAEFAPLDAGVLLTALTLSGNRVITETKRFESGSLSHIFECLSDGEALWNTTVDGLFEEDPDRGSRGRMFEFMNEHLSRGKVTVVAPNPSTRDFLVAFNHVGPISQRLPRALIVSYILHVYSAYRSAELFDVVKEQGAALEKLYNNSVFGLMTLSEKGAVETANKIAMQMFDDESLAGKKVRDYLAPEDAGRFDDLLGSVAAVWKEKFVRFSAAVNAPRGRKNFEFALQFEPTSKIFYATVQDTSDLQYYQNYATNEKKIEALGRLASSLTHDLNNIIGSITGYASLLKRKLPPDSKEHHYADIIESSSRRTTELVKEVLGFAQLDAKTLEVVDFNRFCGNIVVDFRKTHGDRYSILMRQSERPIHTRVSTSQLRQVILALLTNAAESMEDGGTIMCTVGLANVPESAPAYVTGGEHCFVEIEDHGIGMDDTIKRRIFEPFFTTKRVKKYTGLSLSMAFNIVKHHKGFIEVGSTPGTGTKVTIYLPSFSEKPKSGPAPEPARTFATKGVKILVVDDEEGVRQLSYDILSEHGYDVVTATDGLQALERLKENPDVKLVVLDMVMPGMGGKDTCMEIKKQDNPPRVLICTGYSELSDLESVLGNYADGFLQKPYSTGEMTKLVDQLLNTVSS